MQKRKPERTQILIIGAGASGATAAKVLTERGIRVTCLERGPWMKHEDFGGDELANVNRDYLTPDALVDPRVVVSPDSPQPSIQTFVPNPQMVGGATTHWTGWALRMLESDFRLRSLHGELEGTTLVDWPIAYQDLERYYGEVEHALGVSGLGGANTFESPRSREYPCAPLPVTRYAKVFSDACARMGYNAFPTPTAMLSTAHDGRPETVQSAFVQMFGDPTGTKSTALSTFIPDALATGKLDLRAQCYVRELTVDAAGRIAGAIYEDADGDLVEQEADVVLLACGAIESARLLLLSTSAAHPDGLANGSGQVGRNLTLHEYTAAIAAFPEEHDPIYGWAGGGYISASTFEFYETDYDRGFLGGCHVAAGGVGIPLPINFTLPDRPAWGAEAKDWDRRYFNRSMALGLVIHDMPQATNRVEIDPTVTDAWGRPVARITHRPHANDLAQSEWIVDRCAEILDDAGAEKVWRLNPKKFSGNAHQHGTLRMGRDPQESVLNEMCRAHEVDNLYAVDSSSFPTATGVNPTLTIMANAWRVAEHLADDGA
jgi:choline dehydrogenase-like flavoprotein